LDALANYIEPYAVYLISQMLCWEWS